MNTIYNIFLKEIVTQDINLIADNLKVALFPDTYAPDSENHEYWNQIAGDQVTGDGYVSGGVALEGKELIRQDAQNNVKFIGDDISWPNSTIDARFAVIYKDTEDPTTSPLILALDFGETKSSVNGTFTIQWSQDGLFTLSQAV